MKRDKVLLHSCFEISGQIFSRTVESGFSITNDDVNLQIVEEGIKSTALSGVISKNKGFSSDVIPNAKVSAYKKGILYDKDITREDGSYFLYLENGVYDIRIEGQTYNRIIKNYEVTNGIKEYKKVIKHGQILEKKLDVIQFAFNNFPSDDYLINGVLIDEHGKPIEGAEIIVALVDDNPASLSREIKAFVKTKKDGRYCFSLPPAQYDVVIRSPKHAAKVLKNYLFIPDEGFFPQIINNSLMFKKGGEWLWISN